MARTIADLRRRIAQWRQRGDRIGLVPTMGALHDGHMALVAAARAECRRVVTTIFVNPKQFAAGEDLARYPRPEAADLDRLRRDGADLAFVPGVDAVYPAGFATNVHVAGLGDGLCGRHRPGHFDGVATVVTKLLLEALPDVAYFGEKDYQQLMIVKRLALDLDIPVRIEGVATVREPDGLALSSRNAYLTPQQRRAAPALAATLHRIAAALKRQPASVAGEIARGSAALEAAGFRIDYLEVRAAADLTPVTATMTAPSRVFAAAWLGRTRLIDNVAI